MAETKLFNCLGLCRRAGKCQSGAFAAQKAVRERKARLVLLQADASAETRAKMEALCRERGVPLRLVPEVGRAIGKDGHVVMAVTDNGFANMILDALASETEVGG